MKILLFAKKRKTHDGRDFTAYVAKLEKKDGTEITTSVKFREECGSPKASECPCYIEVEKKKCNFNVNEYEIVDDDSGEVKKVTSNTLWITDWKASSEKWVDKSMDEFKD